MKRMDNTLLILGAGGHAKVVADSALASDQWQSVAFLDDRFPDLNRNGHWPVIGRITDLESFVEDYPYMALGVGVSYDNLRLEWLSRGLKAGALFLPVIHPASMVSTFASVGKGSVIFAGAIVNIGSSIGEGCILNTNCTLDHDCFIGNGSHVSPGAILAGNVCTQERVWIGMGAQVIQGVTLGADTVIGAGAVVLNDVTSGSTVVGVPARPI